MTIATARAVMLAGLVASCSSSTTSPGTTGSQKFTAKVDGAAWTATTLSTAARSSTNGTFTITGANASGAGMSLVLYNIAAPGVYPIGVGGTLTGGVATYTAGGASWSTPLTGASGTVIISDVGVQHILGTFQFTADPITGTAAAKTVTSGEFDLPVSGVTSITVPDKSGGSMTGTLNGAAWAASTVVFVAQPVTGTLGMGLSNTAQNVTIVISGVNGAGTYALNTGVQRYMSVTNLSGGRSWGGSAAASSGNFVITSLTQTRIKGNYSVTLQPLTATGATGALTMTGTFDVGLQN